MHFQSELYKNLVLINSALVMQKMLSKYDLEFVSLEFLNISNVNNSI